MNATSARSTRFKSWMPLFVVAPLAFLACEGPAGPAGSTGLTGAQGGTGQQGPQGTVGTTGPQGTPPDGGLTTGCMAPCHGFNGIVEQWKTSTHYIGAILNGEELPSWTGPSTCGNCHAADGLPQRVAGIVKVAGDAGLPTNVTLGELNYRTTTGGVTEATFGGQSKVATITCTTCHNISPTNDPHVSGSNYQSGAFPLRVPSGPNDQAVIEKSDAGTVTGTLAGKWGESNTCIFCHKSRKDVNNYISKIANTNLTSVNWGPHEAPQADIFSGLGGYEYGKTYSNSQHQTLEGCVTCHMGPVAANGNAPDHSFRASLATCKSSGCHNTATNFNVKNGQGSTRFALAELQGILNGLNALTRGIPDSLGNANPPLSASELADGHYELDRSRPGASLTPDQAGALYNYFLISRGSAWGVHNPNYVSQLLFDSIDAINGPGKPVSIADPRAVIP